MLRRCSIQTTQVLWGLQQELLSCIRGACNETRDLPALKVQLLDFECLCSKCMYQLQYGHWHEHDADLLGWALHHQSIADSDGQPSSCPTSDLTKMTFHSREHNSRALRNLLDEEYEKASLKDDLRNHSAVKCILPINHISACVAARFKGQSWMRYNEDDLKRDFKQLGLVPKLARLAGTPRRGLITFPSIEGVFYLLRKKGWLTAAELALEDDD